MSDWWMTGFAVMAVAALVMLVTGLLLGYRWGKADLEAETMFPADDGWEVTFQNPGAPWTADVFPVLEHPVPGQVLLTAPALTSPASERTTGFIERITADTDRWIAGIGREDS